MRVIRATTSVGLSSIITVAFAAVRYKFVALALGAPGIGSLGILTSAVALGTVLFGLGLTTSGVQATAAATEDPSRLRRVSTGLLAGSTALGVAAGILVVVLGLVLRVSILAGSLGPALTVWLGISLASTVVSGGQLALLNGLGRIRALAWSNAGGSIIGTLLTIIVGLLSGNAGLMAALAAVPLATLLLSSYAVREERKKILHSSFREWWPELKGMVLLGGVVMLGLLLGSASQFTIRMWLQSADGLQTAGYFQAAWTITSTYLGFVLTALAAEYYPRISKQADEPRVLNVSVDKQLHLVLLLGAPVLLWMMVLTPLTLHLLYAPVFQKSVTVLRWQLFGDLFKLFGWTIAFLLLARRARGAYLVGEILWHLSYLVLAICFFNGSLQELGVAYCAAYALYALATAGLAYKETGFIPTQYSLALLICLLIVGSLVFAGVNSGTALGLGVAITLASLTTIGASGVLIRLRSLEQKSTTGAGGLV